MKSAARKKPGKSSQTSLPLGRLRAGEKRQQKEPGSVRKKAHLAQICDIENRCKPGKATRGLSTAYFAW